MSSVNVVPGEPYTPDKRGIPRDGMPETKGTLMSFKRKVLSSAAVAVGLGTLMLTPGAAFASSTGCAFTNGCATLHGVDAASHGVAMDSKYQSASTGNLIIGYPDNSGDGATDFDAVLHYTPGNNVTTYSDTGFLVSHLSLACSLSGVSSTDIPKKTGTTITAPYPLTVSQANGTDFTTTGPSTSLSFSGTLQDGTVVTETGTGSDAGCAGAFTYHGGTFHLSDPTSLISVHNVGGSVTEFTDSDTGTFSFSGLPDGVSVNGGSLTADSSTAVPGTYSSVGVTFTESSGAAITEAFNLTVDGTSATAPGAPTPYYTFAYAKAGVWSNECVTDTNGSGALTLETCTLGHDHYQDFYALQGGVPQGSLQTDTGGTYHIQNLLSAYGSANSCLIDAATVNPATPETNAFDEATGGRQLAVTGSCTSDATSWSWSS